MGFSKLLGRVLGHLRPLRCLPEGVSKRVMGTDAGIFGFVNKKARIQDRGRLGAVSVGVLGAETINVGASSIRTLNAETLEGGARSACSDIAHSGSGQVPRFPSAQPWGRDFGGLTIELGIVLIVVALFLAGLAGMRVFIDKARMHNTVQKVHTCLYAVAQFQEAYEGAMPGSLADAKARLQAAHEGRGVCTEKGLDPENDCAWAWDHLAAAELVPKPGRIINGVPVMAVSYPGGFLSLIYAGGAYFFELGALEGNTTSGPLLTLAQASELAAKFPESQVKKSQAAGQQKRAYSVRILIGRGG